MAFQDPSLQHPPASPWMIMCIQLNMQFPVNLSASCRQGWSSALLPQTTLVCLLAHGTVITSWDVCHLLPHPLQCEVLKTFFEGRNWVTLISTSLGLAWGWTASKQSTRFLEESIKVIHGMWLKYYYRAISLRFSGQKGVGEDINFTIKLDSNSKTESRKADSNSAYKNEWQGLPRMYAGEESRPHPGFVGVNALTSLAVGQFLCHVWEPH